MSRIFNISIISDGECELPSDSSIIFSRVTVGRVRLMIDLKFGREIAKCFFSI